MEVVGLDSKVSMLAPGAASRKGSRGGIGGNQVGCVGTRTMVVAKLY